MYSETPGTSNACGELQPVRYIEKNVGGNKDVFDLRDERRDLKKRR